MQSVQYVLNMLLTSKHISSRNKIITYPCYLVPAIIYIDKWGRRPMLLCGTLAMGFFLYLVGGLQARFGHWGDIGGTRTSLSSVRHGLS